MMKEITPSELKENPFDLIGRQWMLVTAGTEEKSNTMTVSWGGLDVMWGKDVAYIVIRPQRYTKEFIDQEKTLSLSVLPSGHMQDYAYLGRVSGRNENKLEKVGLTTAFEEGTPYIQEARLVLICEKLFAQPYQPESFLGEGLTQRWYPEEDYHTLYICEIKKILVKEEAEEV